MVVPLFISQLFIKVNTITTKINKLVLALLVLTCFLSFLLLLLKKMWQVCQPLFSFIFFSAIFTFFFL